jgi:hypothetical protein
MTKMVNRETGETAHVISQEQKIRKLPVFGGEIFLKDGMICKLDNGLLVGKLPKDDSYQDECGGIWVPE